MKRLSKTEREEQQKQQLRNRLIDIAYGANGGCSLECCEVDFDFYRNLSVLARNIDLDHVTEPEAVMAAITLSEKLSREVQ